MDQDLDSVAEGLFQGVPPDSEPFRGGPLEPRISFSGVHAVTSKQSDRGGKTLITATLASGEDGVYVDSSLFQRFLNLYPRGKDALLKAFAKQIKIWTPKIKADIVQVLKNPHFTNKLTDAVFGWGKSADWESPEKITISPAFFYRPELRRGSIHIHWSVEVEFTTQEKAGATAVFSEMGDRELDGWIGQFENDAPENFWQDGELRSSRSQAYKMYRDHWRKMSPRDQQAQLDSLQSRHGRYASAQRVAARFQRTLRQTS